ncbi:hypothetical protein BDW67DRAFT_167920 [Aspergillus spinulosporus]
MSSQRRSFLGTAALGAGLPSQTLDPTIMSIPRHHLKPRPFYSFSTTLSSFALSPHNPDPGQLARIRSGHFNCGHFNYVWWGGKEES